MKKNTPILTPCELVVDRLTEYADDLNREMDVASRLLEAELVRIGALIDDLPLDLSPKASELLLRAFEHYASE